MILKTALVGLWHRINVNRWTSLSIQNTWKNESFNPDHTAQMRHFNRRLEHKDVITEQKGFSRSGFVCLLNESLLQSFDCLAYKKMMKNFEMHGKDETKLLLNDCFQLTEEKHTFEQMFCLRISFQKLSCFWAQRAEGPVCPPFPAAQVEVRKPF